MSTTRKSGCKLAVLCAVLVLALGPAWAAVPNPYSSTLVNNMGGLHELGLTATVTYNDTTGLYHYDYMLSFTSSWASRGVASFSVDNPNHSPFTNAGTDKPVNFLIPPDYDGTDLNRNSVFWGATGVPLPYSATGTARFWFDSPWGPEIVPATTGGGWGATSGTTLGIAAPEPASIAGLAGGLAALAAVIRRRR